MDSDEFAYYERKLGEFEAERVALEADEEPESEEEAEASSAPEPTCQVAEDCESGWCGTVFVDGDYYSKDCVEKYDCDTEFTTLGGEVIAVTCNDDYEPSPAEVAEEAEGSGADSGDEGTDETADEPAADNEPAPPDD